MKIYLASSWRNAMFSSVLRGLRNAGHQVYDFKGEDEGQEGTPDTFAFEWEMVDPAWRAWTPEQYSDALAHPLAQRGFKSDFRAMWWADACVLLLPCNRSAHLELGWMLGKGRPGWVYTPEPRLEPELMYLLCTGFHTKFEDLLGALSSYEDAQLLKKDKSLAEKRRRAIVEHNA